MSLENRYRKAHIGQLTSHLPDFREAGERRCDLVCYVQTGAKQLDRSSPTIAKRLDYMERSNTL